ncbi:MAG: OmpA family protein [Bacteroidales bacterium]|nr:OmpA family protein [Bacteroidales bacterium]
MLTSLGILLLLGLCPPTWGQRYATPPPIPQLSTRFVRHTVESEAKGVVFNAFIVQNKGAQAEHLTVSITVPQGWRLIGSDKVELHLAPGDSSIVPIRVTVSALVRGDIGYSIVASLLDSKGNTVKNDYCFVKIPGTHDLSYKLLGGVAFLDPTKRTSQFGVLVQNRGNHEETVSFLLDGNQQLGIGPERHMLHTLDVVVQPFSDTTITFGVTQSGSNTMGRNIFPLSAQISSANTMLRRTVWFRSVESLYINNIDAQNKPLTVELNVQGLLDERLRPIYSATIFGRTLFRGSSDLYYYYRNYASGSAEDLYYKSRVYVGTNVGRWNIELGDNFRYMEGSLFGRGGYLSYGGRQMQFVALANKDLNSDMTNAAVRTAFSVHPRASVLAGANYSQQPSTAYRSAIGYLGTTMRIAQVHQLQAVAAYNRIDQQLDGKGTHHEWGGELQYSSHIGSVRTSVNIEHHTPLYNSYKAGRTQLNARSIWSVNEHNSLIASIYELQTKNHLLGQQSIANTVVNQNGEYSLEHQHQMTRTSQLFYGPIYRRLGYRTRSALFRPGADMFRSHSYGMVVGARLSLSNNTLIIVPRVELALPTIASNPFPSDTQSNRPLITNYQHISLNIRSPRLGLIALLSMGPRSVSDQMNFAQRRTATKRLVVIPSYRIGLFDNKLLLTASANYNNDLISKFSYMALTGMAEASLPRSWYLSFLTQYNIQRRVKSTENFDQYQTLYAEATVRKEFGFQQPRVKYYNVELVFFKDMNGDNVQGDNEPGIKNVLVELQRIDDGADTRQIPHNIASAELLSDNLGRVRFENLPDGLYRISYNPLGNDVGSFSKILDNVELHVNAHGVHYFPFAERNKVFGRIIMNRSKLSGLGHIDVSNIRITASDSRGNVFSTLTDKNGEFVLYAPVTDEYVVNVNNIFHENFDLRQNNFHVQFNDYKQFEVNYVFDEKVRQINFAQAAPSPLDGPMEAVQQIRRTTLRGTVKDAQSLAPLRATINLLNPDNNTAVQSMRTNPQTGAFGMTFVAADEFIVEVQADGYWHHTENLVLNQITTFMNVNRDILLQPITIGSKIETNARFDPGSAALQPNTVAELNRVLRILRANSHIQLEIQGHADAVEQLNNPLISEQRAQAVARYLIEHGFGNVVVAGMGDLLPVAPSDTEANRSQNRRIEIVVVDK